LEYSIGFSPQELESALKTAPGRAITGGVKDPWFRFRLERVPWLRQQSERSGQEALVASLERRSESERRLREVDERIESARLGSRLAATRAELDRSA
jgi:hypothetical protein